MTRPPVGVRRLDAAGARRRHGRGPRRSSLFSPRADAALEQGRDDPWTGADWAASWRRTTVNEQAWTALRERLRQATRHWQAALELPREMSDVELNGVIGSVAHLAYHLGAIRQIDRSIQGPKAE